MYRMYIMDAVIWRCSVCGGDFWLVDPVRGVVWGILWVWRNLSGGPLCGGSVWGNSAFGCVGSVFEAGSCVRIFLRVWGGVGEGLWVEFSGGGLFVWGILRVWCDFLVCALCGVLRVGDSSSSVLKGTRVWGEGFSVGALCFFFLPDFFWYFYIWFTFKSRFFPYFTPILTRLLL